MIATKNINVHGINIKYLYYTNNDKGNINL